MGLSRSTIIDRLENWHYFTKQEAIAGVDKTNTNWNSQALIKANSYLGEEFGDGYSKLGLIDTLKERDLLKHSEAVYASENVVADWKAQAIKSAKYALTDSWNIFSTKGLSQELIRQKYTETETTYAIESIDYKVEKVEYPFKSKN